MGDRSDRAFIQQAVNSVAKDTISTIKNGKTVVPTKVVLYCENESNSDEITMVEISSSFHGMPDETSTAKFTRIMVGALQWSELKPVAIVFAAEGKYASYLGDKHEKREKMENVFDKLSKSDIDLHRAVSVYGVTMTGEKSMVLYDAEEVTRIREMASFDTSDLDEDNYPTILGVENVMKFCDVLVKAVKSINTGNRDTIYQHLSDFENLLSVPAKPFPTWRLN